MKQSIKLDKINLSEISFVQNWGTQFLKKYKHPPITSMVKTCESWIPPSPNLDKVKVSFDELNNTDLFSQLHAVYIVHRMIKGTQHPIRNRHASGPVQQKLSFVTWICHTNFTLLNWYLWKCRFSFWWKVWNWMDGRMDGRME